MSCINVVRLPDACEQKNAHFILISNVEDRSSSVLKKGDDDFRGVRVLSFYKMDEMKAWCGQEMELDGQY